MNTQKQGAGGAFIVRALASRDEARSTGKYVAAEEVLRRLDDKLRAAQDKSGERRAKR